MAKNLQYYFFSQTYQFNFRIGFTVLCLFFFVLFCVLGVWQLHRYSFKKKLIIDYQQRLTSHPKTLQEITKDTLQFQPLSVEGNYENDLTVIVQNQFRNGEDGFEIVTPLRPKKEKKLLLVDRGWIKKTGDALPKISAVKAQQHISGHIKEINEYQFILGKNILAHHPSYFVVQKININELQRITNKDYYPFILRLDASQPNGFVREWTMSTMMPERHMGYAIQWFVMAGVLLIAYLCFCFERVKK